MSAVVWVTMALVCAYVWGGFLLLLAVAMGKERQKTQPPGPARPS